MNVEIAMQEASSPASLQFGTWDLGVVGKTVDDRGHVATDFVHRYATKLISAEYDSEDFSLELDGAKWPGDEVIEAVRPWQAKSILIEATTCGFAELFLVLRGLVSLGPCKLSFLYVEPGEYTHSRHTPLLHRRDFELSQEVPGYRGIPGAGLVMTDLRDQRAVFFLGYEERRLDRALEDFQMIRPDNCAVVFGVPAFQPGWEMDAFANNIRVMRERNLNGGVYFCGAENPASALRVLGEIQSELSQNERLMIAPIGTKPNGIAAAIYAATNAGVGLLYDHPRRRAKRSQSSANWHLYEVSIG